MDRRPGLGSHRLEEDSCSFLVWAPQVDEVSVRLTAPAARLIRLEPDARGYHHAVVEGVAAGDRYFYRLSSGNDRPDPASRSQPEGVHGPSEVVDTAFEWTDGDWKGLPLERYVLYEMHVGTFTSEGTFDAAANHLDYLKDLGVTAIELMPIGQFPGTRNWGYDGVYPFAVQRSYGGREGLKQFVDRCHARGIAVTLDVIYNHLGPEGNYLSEYGPYFTERYRSPWGAALNFDSACCDEVRRFFIENALQWIDEFHIDSLRLDAADTINDQSANPFLRELATAVQSRAETLNRTVTLVAETDRNDPRFALPPALGGLGLDGIWNDGFHHALHSLVTGETAGYYTDFGSVQHLERGFTDGFIYTGQYSRFRKRRHGAPARGLRGSQLVVFSQNHDQIGNRMLGDRLSERLAPAALRLTAATALLGPGVPLLFMGEEYAERAPFLYFVSHGDEDLIEAVRKGRREEFASFLWAGEPPDPQAAETFARSRLDHTLRQEPAHRAMLEFYKALLALRREIPVLAASDRAGSSVRSFEEERVLYVHRALEDSEIFAIYSFSAEPRQFTLETPSGRWRRRCDSQERRWQGDGTELPESLDVEGTVALKLGPWQFTLYSR